MFLNGLNILGSLRNNETIMRFNFTPTRVTEIKNKTKQIYKKLRSSSDESVGKGEQSFPVCGIENVKSTMNISMVNYQRAKNRSTK